MQRLIKQMRETRGENQAQFAARLGITQAMLSYLESGDRVPGRKTIKALLTIATEQEAQAILNALRDGKQGYEEATDDHHGI